MNKQILNSNEIKTIHGLKNEEKETNINWFNDSNTAVVYTTDNKMLTKMKRLFEKNPNSVTCTEYYSKDGTVDSYRFEFPLKGISFRNTDALTKKRNISEAQRKAAADRMKNARINKN